MKRQKTNFLYRNKVVYYVREESSIHKKFYKYKGGVLSYNEFFDSIEELNDVIYCNYDFENNNPYLAEVGQTDFTDRYKNYL